MDVKNDKKNLLVVSSSFPCWEGSNSGPFVFELSRRLTDHFNVTVLTPRTAGAKAKEEWAGLSVFRCRCFWPVGLKKFRHDAGLASNIKRHKWLIFILPFYLAALFFKSLILIRREKIDVVQAHWIVPAGLIALLAARICRKPLVITAHGSDVILMKKPFLRGLVTMIIRGADAITATSAVFAKEILEKCRMRADKVHILPMGVDTDHFYASQKFRREGEKRIAEQTEKNITGPCLLFVGRIEKEKGVHCLVQAMPEILRYFRRAKLFLIGEGYWKEEFRRFAQRLGVAENIFLLGSVLNEELVCYYNRADVFILPSFGEGLPVVLMEAMASGCSVVATAVGGVPSMIKDGESGLLIQPGQPGEISKAVIKVLSDRNFRHRIGKNAREIVEEYYNWKIVADNLCEIIKQVNEDTRCLKQS